MCYPFLLKNTEELRAKRKKELKKDSASKIKSLVDEVRVRQTYGRWCELQASFVGILDACFDGSTLSELLNWSN
jgi:heme oxygenase